MKQKKQKQQHIVTHPDGYVRVSRLVGSIEGKVQDVIVLTVAQARIELPLNEAVWVAAAIRRLTSEITVDEAAEVSV